MTYTYIVYVVRYLCWKKEHGFSPDAQVFIVSPTLYAMRDALLERGWVA